MRSKSSAPSETLGGTAQIQFRIGASRAAQAPTSDRTGPGGRGTDLPASTPIHRDLDALLDSISLARTSRLNFLLQECDPTSLATADLMRLVERMPAPHSVTLTLAQISDTAGTASVAIDMHERCLQRGLPLYVNLILNEKADVLEYGSASPDDRQVFPLVLIVSRSLRASGVPVRWLVPVLPTLVHRLEPIFSLARDQDVDPVLAPHWIMHPAGKSRHVTLDSEERLFVHDFITYRLLDEEAHLHSQARNSWYRMLDGALTHHGSMEPAEIRRAAVITAAQYGNKTGWALDFDEQPAFDVSESEDHAPQLDRNAIGRATRLFTQAREVCGVLFDGIRAVVQWICACTTNSTKPRLDGGNMPPLKNVLLIGAYGGDHIGDTAILGGVLLRLSTRYGTMQGVLMSQRPFHTGHLTPMLETPVELKVQAYEHARIRECLPNVDAVVFAGGPLIDQPKQLVRHLYTASMAARRGKPFIMEGIGPGPFPRWPSEWTARRLVHLARRIVVRTSADSGTDIMRGIEHQVGRDPAFDYLETRGKDLTRLGAEDRDWIERLLENTNGRLRIGINVRPIRHHFTVGVPAAQRVEYTRAVESRFEENLATALLRFHRQSTPPPCFVFFPMNAIQFGMSDLRSAYHVHRHLPEDVDYRVWQADASLDGVLALLRRLDLVITMRFHATIFALSQQRNVIGIDYRIGQRDKVGALLDDFGLGEHCCRIDEFTSEWLLERLGAFIGTRDSALPQHDASPGQDRS